MPITIRKSKTYNLVGTFVSFILIILSLIGLPSQLAIFAFFMLITSIGLFFISIISLRDSIPQVILDKNGIYAKELGNEKIAWSDIKSVGLRKLPRGGAYITFELHDDTLYPSLGYKGIESKIMMAYGLSRLTITVTALDISPTQLLNLIQQKMLHIDIIL